MDEAIRPGARRGWRTVLKRGGKSADIAGMKAIIAGSIFLVLVACLSLAAFLTRAKPAMAGPDTGDEDM